MQHRKILITLLTVFLVAAVLVLPSFGCGNSAPGTTNTGTNPTSASGVSLSNDIQPIFSDKCVICHQGSLPNGELNLEPSRAYGELVNADSTESPLKRVAPGNPGQSYLIAKLNGTQAQVGGSGAQMPYGGPPLPSSQISTISNWIQQGATNN